MTAPRCICGPASRRPSKAAASLLSGLLLLILPKCPFCIAAWLTVATGIGISATGVTYLRAGLLLLWIAALSPLLWRRLSAVAPSARGRRLALPSWGRRLPARGNLLQDLLNLGKLVYPDRRNTHLLQ